MRWIPSLHTGRRAARDVAHLSRRPAARKEVPVIIAMKRDVEDALVAVENFLGAVAMVNILAMGWGKT